LVVPLVVVKAQQMVDELVVDWVEQMERKKVVISAACLVVKLAWLMDVL
jgi:hypothetical protein